MAGENKYPDVLYMDADLLAINKPAGLLSIRDGYHPDLPFTASLLEPQFGKLWIVHRLDKDTSGIMILARTAAAHAHLNTQFSHRKVEKIYHCVAVGCPDVDHFMIDIPLQVNGDRRHRTIPNHVLGKAASTEIHVLERFSNKFFFLSACPATGYTHQIRSHLAATGFAILSDSLYTPRSEPFASLPEIFPGYPWINRMALHASKISFLSPSTNQPVSFTAPFPADFDAALFNLRSINK